MLVLANAVEEGEYSSWVSHGIVDKLSERVSILHELANLAGELFIAERVYNPPQLVRARFVDRLDDGGAQAQDGVFQAWRIREVLWRSKGMKDVVL